MLKQAFTPLVVSLRQLRDQFWETFDPAQKRDQAIVVTDRKGVIKGVYIPCSSTTDANDIMGTHGYSLIPKAMDQADDS